MTTSHVAFKHLRGFVRGVGIKLAAPFYAVELELVVKSGMAVGEHLQIAFFRGAYAQRGLYQSGD